MSTIGTYPTPLQHVPSLSTPKTSLWIKHDDATNATYGGNKIRKLEKILADATARGARRIVTVGAVGSHHVLTTGIFARKVGLAVEAIVVAQPGSPHVVENLRADLAQGVTLFPASSYVHAALRVASRLGSGAYYVPAGGSNRLGSEAYREAAQELATQVKSGVMPEPDLVVVPLGSGGTAAGLAAGFAMQGMRTRVLGVTVAAPPWWLERQARHLACACAPGVPRREVLEHLAIDRGYLGAGYGVPTKRGREATRAAATVGVALDDTYTAKAFAAALDRVALGAEATILYWHTLSSAPMAPLLVGAPDAASLDERLRRLVLPEAGPS